MNRRHANYLALFAGIMLATQLSVIRAEEAGGAVNATQDPRLATHVDVRAEGIPLSRILSAITRETGVRLECVGSGDDERLVAFAHDRPLDEVMRSVAALYRLQWVRTGEAGKLAYRLERPAASARAASTLRERHLGTLFRTVADRLAHPQPTNGAADWSPVYPDLLPLLAARLDVLMRDGSLTFRVAELPLDVQDRVAPKLQALLDRWRERVSALEDQANAGRLPGPRLRSGETLNPPAQARDCTVYAELQLAAAPEIWVGLRTPGGTVHRWVVARDDTAATLGVPLYAADHTLQPTTATTVGPDDLLERPVKLATRKDRRPKDWIAELGRLADASGVPIYADCYANYLQGMDGHPRGAFALRDRSSVHAALDLLCGPPPTGSTSQRHSFWWRQDGVALVRSSRWLWEELAVIPDSLTERLVTSVRREGQLDVTDLPALAQLSRFQVQGSGFLMGRSDVWNNAVQVPVRLSTTARQALLHKGITWEGLAPPDREAVLRLLPLAGESQPRYRAQIETAITDLPCQGGAMLRTTLRAERGYGEGTALLYLPLSGYAPSPELKPTGLIVRARTGG